MMADPFAPDRQRRNLAALEGREGRLRQRALALLAQPASRLDPARLALLDDLQRHLAGIQAELERVGTALAEQRGRQTAMSRYLRASAYGQGSNRSSKG